MSYECQDNPNRTNRPHIYLLDSLGNSLESICRVSLASLLGGLIVAAVYDVSCPQYEGRFLSQNNINQISDALGHNDIF